MRPAPILSTVLLSAVLALPALAGDTLLVIRSEPGDWLGQGQTRVLRPPTHTFTTSDIWHRGIKLIVSGPYHWTVEGSRGRRLPMGPGAYRVRDRFVVGDTLPSFGLFGEGRGCETFGYIDVRQIAYDASGAVRKLWLFYEHHCDDAPAAATGEVRIDADTTVTILAPLHVRARRGQQVAFDVATAHSAARPLTLAATVPAGASFADRGDGTGRFQWTPGTTQQGPFTVAFLAQDDLGVSSVAHTLVEVDGDTLLDVTSEPGDAAWLGRSCRLRPGDARIEARTTTESGAYVSFFPKDLAIGTRNFLMRPARPGNFSLLRRYSDESYAGGSFVATLPPGGCAGVETHYRVRRADLGPGEIVSGLWVEWEQHCNGAAPAFRGELRLNAGSPVVVYAPIARRVHYGDTLRFPVTVRDTLGRPVTLHAGSLPAGSNFVITGPTTAEWSWCPPPSAAGAHRLMFRAANAEGEADTVITDVVVTGDVSASVVSEPGDRPGLGAQAHFEDRPGLLLASLGGDPFLGTIDDVQVHAPGSSWKIQIRSPQAPSGILIKAGRYSVPWPQPVNALYFLARNTSTFQGLSWWTSDFRIRQLERTPGGHPRRLWLEFEQSAEDRMPILRGDLRLDARWSVLARAPIRRRGNVHEPLAFDVTGETPDGEVPSLTAVALPPGATFTLAEPGRARFEWMPLESDVGVAHAAGFVARRADGATDTVWTALEALALGVVHVEERDRTWHLTSNDGQLRMRGWGSWARVTFSSPRADTLWSASFDAGYGDTLRVRSYLANGWGPLACVEEPGTYACDQDTGRFEITRFARQPNGTPLTLWGTFVHGLDPPDTTRSGWVSVGSLGTLASAPTPVALEFACSAVHPNPAAGGHAVDLAIPRRGTVGITVYDVAGRRRAEDDLVGLPAGRHRLPLRLGALPPGIYHVRIRYEAATVVRRLVIVP